ncbi:ecdysteroid udp-glucosyltransferase [Lasius niger]|uniref:Ecdysteroid udp-glucosyltransferase n=1 Tax=Lasius niger TaxID=67767 RepID=A0A0J7NRK9_LASNI|nr:ecdysteroid udp-glucosyltransferase [Lasius niger]
MKVCEEWFRAGWYAAYVVLCVCAHPARDRSNEMHFSRSRLFDPESTNGFEKEVSATKLFESHEDSVEEFEENSPLRAIATRAKSNPALLPLIIEPEAEMLPRGYKGVKPPGVTHMEFAFAKPQTDTSVRESATLRALMINDDENFDKFGGFGRDGDAHYVASKHEEQIARNDRGSESLVVLEVGLKDDLKQKSKKTDPFRRKSHFENEDRAKNHKEKVVKKKQNIYKTGNAREKTPNGAGYSNVYHEDEFEKDADFYDDGRQSEHFEKHGRYGEKHATPEDTYAKGKSNGSRLVDVEANERGKFEKTRLDREAQGHATMDSSGTLTDS